MIENNNNILVRESCLLAADPDGEAVPDELGRAWCIKRNGGGKLSRLPHFASLERRRQEPGNCRRCGKTNGNGKAYCDRCRAYQSAYKLRKRKERYEQPSEVLKALAQFRRELTALRRTVKTMARARRESYLRGFMAGQRNYRRNRNKHLARYLDAYPSISRQEIATMNHAYANPKS